MLIASLPMYDLPELREIRDAWWTSLARIFRYCGVQQVPDKLLDSARFGAEWQSPHLLFSQCCGYNLVFENNKLSYLVATPVYAARGCDGALYRSFIVVRENETCITLADLRGKICAVNMPRSHSGYNVLRYLIAPLTRRRAFFSKVIESGSHAASMLAVGRGDADVAAIDCVSFTLLRRYRPNLARGLRILNTSPATPGLPFITNQDAATAKKLARGLSLAIADPGLNEIRRKLYLSDIQYLPAEAYARIRDIQEQAYADGYPILK